MSTITAFIPVFNEEKRLHFTLSTLGWCDEIVILDKSSTDNTIAVAKKFNVKIISKGLEESYTSDEFEYMTSECSSDWIVLITASDLISRGLAKEIRKCIDEKSDDFDVIDLPFKNYVLGIGESYSPWSTKFRTLVFRKTSILINKDKVHNAMSSLSSKKYIIDYLSDREAVYHLTHEHIATMMDRHIRYWKGEANDLKYSLGSAFRNVLGALKKILIRGTLFYGRSGIALSFAYLSYFMMSYVYRWEKKESEASEIYRKIRDILLNEWKDENR